MAQEEELIFPRVIKREYLIIWENITSNTIKNRPSFEIITKKNWKNFLAKRKLRIKSLKILKRKEECFQGRIEGLYQLPLVK